MTLPNVYLKGQHLFFTRNVINKAHLLDMGDDEVRTIVEYVFGHYASQWDVILHSLTVVSNHLHFTCTDTNTQIDKFLGDVFRVLSMALNKRADRVGALWEPNEEPHRVYIANNDFDTLAEKTAYTIINGYRHRYVDDYSSWDGLVSPVESIGDEREVARLDCGFGKRSSLPDDVTLKFAVPPNIEAAEWVALVEKKIALLEKEYEDEPMRELPEVGYVPRISRSAKLAKQRKEWGSRFLRSFAGPRHVRVAMIAAYLDFLERYRRAQNAWQPGQPQTVLFPAGTGALRAMVLVEDSVSASGGVVPEYIARNLDGANPINDDLEPGVFVEAA